MAKQVFGKNRFFHEIQARCMVLIQGIVKCIYDVNIPKSVYKLDDKSKEIIGGITYGCQGLFERPLYFIHR